MRLAFTFALVSFVTIVQSQIIITTNHLPDAGDTLLTRNAMLLDDVDLEETGPNHTWNFGFDILEPLNMNGGIPCYNVDDTPIVYQFMFNNPFDPEYNSDFGIGVEQADIATVNFEDAYMYYQNSNTKYAITGMGATINGLPIASHMDDPDLIYRLPLVYGNADTTDSELSFEVPQLGYYGLEQTREYQCDGWGTLNIWDQSFDVLRVRSVVNASDSIFTSFINLGITLPRPETITYEWLSTEHIEPILKITTAGGFVTQVQTADIYEDPSSITEQQVFALEVYPNPAKNELYIVSSDNKVMSADIIDAQGRKVVSTKVSNRQPIDISALQAGVYSLILSDGNKTVTKTFIKE